MKVIRRLLVAISMAGAIAGALRFRGKGGIPPQQGGWREVPAPSPTSSPDSPPSASAPT